MGRPREVRGATAEGRRRREVRGATAEGTGSRRGRGSRRQTGEGFGFWRGVGACTPTSPHGASGCGEVGNAGDRCVEPRRDADSDVPTTTGTTPLAPHRRLRTIELRGGRAASCGPLRHALILGGHSQSFSVAVVLTAVLLAYGISWNFWRNFHDRGLAAPCVNRALMHFTVEPSARHREGPSRAGYTSGARCQRVRLAAQRPRAALRLRWPSDPHTPTVASWPRRRRGRDRREEVTWMDPHCHIAGPAVAPSRPPH